MNCYRLFITGIFILSGLHISAQVTIGLDTEPEKAALLDIKSQKPSFDGGATTNKDGGGVLLPRVVLDTKDELSPFIDKSSMTAQEYQRLRKVYIGLIVYNLAMSVDFSPGIYIWDGNQWDKTPGINNPDTEADWYLEGNHRTDSAKNFMGTKDRKGLSIKTNKTERIIISENGNIGINKPVPSKALDIDSIIKFNDPLYLKGIPVVPSDEAMPLAFLLKDNTTNYI